MTIPFIPTQLKDVLFVYKDEVYKELMAILKFWEEHTRDLEFGGFYGSMDNYNRPDTSAPKGIVMHSRVLWTFSASCSLLKNKSGIGIADIAFKYIVENFIDPQYGGVYWSVDAQGKMLDEKKQIYGLAFCIYGMSEYYKVSKKEDALNVCIMLFHDIEKYSYDSKTNGYLEAFMRDWEIAADLRLSDKDQNEKKTMNTHLHIIEAYVNLYLVWPDKTLKEKIVNLLDIFERFFINKDTLHLNLFFDENWQSRSSLVSYGHDIEAAWLLLRCANIIESKQYIDLFTRYAIEIADAATEGLDQDGGLWYEYEPEDDNLIMEKHSWPQAEAMIGFLNVFQLNGNEKYLRHSLNSWNYIKNNIIDTANGEWFWGRDAENNLMKKEKAGFWKCPYHNTRACIEIIQRISSVLKEKYV